MNKPSEQQIKEAKEVLSRAGYAVESLWGIEDINHAISESDNPGDFKYISDADKLSFLNSLIGESISNVWELIYDCLNDLKE